MKKILIALVSLSLCAFACGLAGCGSSTNTNANANANTTNTANTAATTNTNANTSTATGLSNPVIQADQATVTEKTGMSLPTVEGGSYSYIETGTSNNLAQVEFTKNGVTYCYRMQAAQGTTATDISGMYYSWTATDEAATVAGLPAITHFGSDASLVTWFDIVPGINYSLSAQPAVEIFDLFNVATSLYTPAQGDA